MQLKVNRQEVKFALDTGADVTVLTPRTSRSLELVLQKPDKELVGANGSSLYSLGEAEVKIKSKSSAITTKVSVVEGASRNLLGINEIRELNLLAVVNSVSEAVFNPIREYPKVFEGLGTMPDVFSIKLDPDLQPFQLYAPRRIPVGLRDEAKKELDNMLAKGVIVPVEQPTDWCSGLTIAPKPNGKIRMCVDLTMLNKGVRRETYPLPHISDMLAQLSKGCVFSKLDANAGFWQVKLDAKSRFLTTFITPWGRYCFKRMPFGISSAPEFFQRSMEKILSGLPGVLCMMDDVLVIGENENQHWSRLRAVLDRISRSGMTLRREKCEFGVHSITFLGHVVTPEGVKPDPKKITAILEMPEPTSKKEARTFMGMVNYLSKFNAKLAETGVPIYAVMGKKSEWYWGESQKSAFRMLKEQLTEPPVLCSFSLQKKHRVSADSSKNAIGAVLLQDTESGVWQPVEYASRKLTEAECRYAMVEKEALAITWACEKFDYYLVGRKFEIETDHKPLTTILGEKDLSKLPLRVQRFKLRMMRYDYEIFHTPGSHMFLADSLSRPGGVEDKCLQRCDSVESFVCAYLQDNPVDDRKEELLQRVEEDPDSQQCLTYMQKGWPRRKKLSNELNKLYGCQDELEECGGLIVYQSRLYIPAKLREQYLSQLHEGHQGVLSCRKRAAQYFWWPSMYQDIARYVANCDTCIKHSAVKHQPCMASPLPEKPWQEVGTDVFEYEDKLYLLLVDYYSRWIEAERMPDQTTQSVIKAMGTVFGRLGIPARLRSDNGPCYRGKLFREFVSEHGFEHVTSSPRYPQSNGMAERAVGTVKRLWRKSKDRVGSLFVYRTTPLSAGYSPAELMYGRAVRTKLGDPCTRPVDYSEFERREKELRAKKRDKWNEKFRAKELTELKPGTRVWVKAPTDPGQEGFVVRKDPTPESYWVKVNQSEIRRNRKHLFVLNDSPNSSDCSDDDILPLAFAGLMTPDAGERDVENGNMLYSSDHSSNSGSCSANTTPVSEGGASLTANTADNNAGVSVRSSPNASVIPALESSDTEESRSPSPPRVYQTRYGRMSRRRADSNFKYY